MRKSKKLWHWLNMFMLAMLCVGCDSCDDDPVLNVTGNPNVELSADGASIAAGVTITTENTDWSVTSNDGWLHATKNGQTVMVSADKNPNTTSRKGTVTIIATDDKSQTFTLYITQEGDKPYIKINGLESNSLEFLGGFDGKSGIDYKQSVSITSNVDWNANNIPSWLSISPTNGNGTVQMTIYPTNENISSSDRTTTITLSGNGAMANLIVTQRGGTEQSCYAKPDNILRLTDDIACNFSCGNNTKFFYVRAFPTSALERYTDNELVRSVVSEESRWERTTYSEASLASCFGGQLDNNASYTIVTVSYSNNDKLGDIVKTEVKTKPLVNQPLVEIANVGIGTKNNQSCYGITVRKGQNGYCEKYYVWGAAGSTLSSVYIYPAVIGWYLKQEIKTNSISHETNINRYFDKMTDLRSVGREYLHGPLSQEESISSDLLYSNDDRYLDVVAWGIDSDGELSGFIENSSYTIGNDAPKKSVRSNPTTTSNSKGFKILPKP